MKVLFVGPTLAGRPFDASGLVVRGPARQGDLFVAVEDGATAIGLIDGVFGSVPSVWHKEILYALQAGVVVLGGASLGALRTAECAAYGMEPIGRIAEDYLSGRRTADADVCLAHCPAELDYLPLSEPLVDVEATLETLARRGLVSGGEVKAVLAAAHALFFADRSVDAMFALVDLPAMRRAELQVAYLAGHFSQKAADARLLVERLRELPGRRGPAPPGWTFVPSDPWRFFLSQRGPC